MFDTYTFSRVSAGNREKVEPIRAFLVEQDLDIDSDVEYFVVAYSDQHVIGCGGIASNILKSIAIAPALQGSGFSLKLMTELTNFAYEMGRFHLFLFTKPENIPLFRATGFFPIAQVGEQLALLENSKNKLSRYCQQLSLLKVQAPKVGSIVMNANPFTLGHQYLVEKAASECDWLHLFVVQEEGSEFAYMDRFDMIQQGTRHIANLTVHPGSKYIISKATFPTYFIKDQGVVDYCHTAIDLQIFRQHIAPALGITHRFVGTEPHCVVTRNYNQQMQHWLHSPLVESPAIECVEVPRLTSGEQPISASRVRALLVRGDFGALETLLPRTTLEHLRHEPLRAGVQPPVAQPYDSVVA
ncbi:[citrate (pro-3S)-lyase] ligase [Photobacterium sp. MCCC 1A19761]|uniref:[citrate (pro-3S)-lyase] ligase n=1 Tax=Photobacterium sp. MCCC 1A19761 TaxID=3115000 RepID=UPI00307E0FAE